MSRKTLKNFLLVSLCFLMTQLFQNFVFEAKAYGILAQIIFGYLPAIAFFVIGFLFFEEIYDEMSPKIVNKLKEILILLKNEPSRPKT